VVFENLELSTEIMWVLQIYDSTLRVRLGITAGFTMVVKSYPGKGPKNLKKQKLYFPDRYEAMYTFYLGDMGHVSAQVWTSAPNVSCSFLVSVLSNPSKCSSENF
jgi:hypothetical protein